MEKKNELQVFTSEQFGQVRTMTIDGDDYFNLYDIGFGLGLTSEAKGKLYLYKSRIVTNCENLDIKGFDTASNFFTITKDVDFESTYITEDSFYDLCLESKAKNARSFRKWVTSEVLPSLRKRGVYIMEHAEEKVIDNEKLFGKRRLKNTFANAEIYEVEKLYEDCINYISDQYNTKNKITMLQSIYNGLSESNLKLSQDAVKNIGKCYDVSLLQHRVLQDKAKYQNKRNGGIKSSKTKAIDRQGRLITEQDEIIKEQQNKISTLNPSIEEYMVLDTHPMSENYLYETVKDEMIGKNIIVKTYAYKNWIKKFPSFQLKDKEELNVDWNKPIIVFLKYDCLEKFDVQNFTKATIDQIITRDFNEDDNIVDKIIVERNKTVDTYDKGRIYIYIRNVE